MSLDETVLIVDYHSGFRVKKIHDKRFEIQRYATTGTPQGTLLVKWETVSVRYTAAEAMCEMQNLVLDRAGVITLGTCLNKAWKKAMDRAVDAAFLEYN